MDHIVLMEYSASTDDVHKILSPGPTTADNRQLSREVELSSTLQASWWSMHGTNYGSVINVHMCGYGVPCHARSYDSGMLAAYENQPLKTRKIKQPELCSDHSFGCLPYRHVAYFPKRTFTTRRNSVCNTRHN